jgi:hypothetical protein
MDVVPTLYMAGVPTLHAIFKPSQAWNKNLLEKDDSTYSTSKLEVGKGNVVSSCLSLSLGIQRKDVVIRH